MPENKKKTHFPTSHRCTSPGQKMQPFPAKTTTTFRHCTLFFFFSLFFQSLTCDPTDTLSLLDFKLSITDDPGKQLSGWIPANNAPCEWNGITCDRFSGRVVALNLTGAPFCRNSNSPGFNKLAGTLTPSIGNLTELRVLSLSCNAFSGEIPVEITGLQSLQILDLHGNNFSGYLPENLIGKSGLEVIDLSSNQLSGKIVLNRLTRCESLKHLHLIENYLVDKIPPEIGNCSNLRTLLLAGNILEGPIPAEIGRIPELRVLDVSRNSLTDRIPVELAQCVKLSVLVLTDVLDFESDSREEFNAFVGTVPTELFLIPNLKIFWAPRANLYGELPENRSGFCNLRVLNLGQNYISGRIPNGFSLCRNLSFLDLSLNRLTGSFPDRLRVECMIYLNVSGNSMTGSVSGFTESNCSSNNLRISLNDQGKLDENLENMYYSILVGSYQSNNPFGSILTEGFIVLHDFSWNSFVGPPPLIRIGDGLLADQRPSYGLLLNNNRFNGSFPGSLFLGCKDLQSFAVNLSVNQMVGEISSEFSGGCLQLKSLEAAFNRLEGPIPSDIGNFRFLSRLDLRGNRLNGTVPDHLGKLKDLQQFLLGENNLTGEIPFQLGQLGSLIILDLSGNSLTGTIPSSLLEATKLRVVLFDHNGLSGEIPSSFSALANLTELDVSYNNLSGSIPHLEHLIDCDSFRGNFFLQPCSYPNASSPTALPHSLSPQSQGQQSSKSKSFEIAMVTSASVVVFILIVLVLALVLGRRKLVRLPSLRRKLVVTFTDTPAELNYENVVRGTRNFSIQNLIGMGGFGATYKAELVPGYLIAVKKLSVGRFQGIQQFDAEIKTLGRIRHKNLVTLIGYYMGESEMFLIYNYLPGGNLESYIHERSGRNIRWSVIHKIALDIAHALAYLHYSCIPRIVHRDIKPSNILLDEELNAYLSDFGLARLLEVSDTHATTDVAGTFGYVAPEYATTCKVTDKADVYSFGVVLLELISGKRSFDPSFSDYRNGFNIVAWGKLLIKEGRTSELFSPALWEAGPQDLLVEMLGVALACTVESLSIRPSMKQVVQRLKQLKQS